jgi:hypothetical protein
MNESEGMRASGPDGRPHPPKAPIEEAPGGIFPSWRALYLTLLAYTGLAVIVLWVLTHLMNAGRP